MEGGERGEREGGRERGRKRERLGDGDMKEGKGERRRRGRLTGDTRVGDDVSEAPSSHRHHRQAGGHGF